MDGMSLFNITDIQSDLLSMSGNVSLNVDYMRIVGINGLHMLIFSKLFFIANVLLGNYKMRGVIGSIIPVFGNGKFLLHPKEVKVSVFVQMGYVKGHF